MTNVNLGHATAADELTDLVTARKNAGCLVNHYVSLSVVGGAGFEGFEPVTWKIIASAAATLVNCTETVTPGAEAVCAGPAAPSSLPPLKPLTIVAITTMRTSRASARVGQPRRPMRSPVVVEVRRGGAWVRVVALRGALAPSRERLGVP